MRVGRRHRGVLLAGVLGVLQFAHATTVGLHARAGLGCPSRAAGLQIRQDPYHVTAAFGPCQGTGYLSLGLGYDPPGWPATLRLELGSVVGTPATSLEIGAYWTYRSIYGSPRLEALLGGGTTWTPLGTLPLYQGSIAVILYPPFELTPVLGSLKSAPGPACTNPHDPPEDSLGPYLERLRRRTLTAFLSAYGDVYALRSAEIDVREIARQKNGATVRGSYAVVLFNKQTGRTETYAGAGWLKLGLNGCGWFVIDYGT